MSWKWTERICLVAVAASVAVVVGMACNGGLIGGIVAFVVTLYLAYAMLKYLNGPIRDYNDKLPKT